MPSHTQLLNQIRDYLLIVFGIAMYAFGFSAFIAPENIITGGMAGLGQVIYYTTMRLFGWGIPVAVSMYAINIIMLAIAFRVVGKQFVIRTVFGVTVISFLIGVMMPLFPEPIVKGQTFMNIIIGSMLAGVGLGIVLCHNGSTGGTDIVGAILSKKRNISFGRTMQVMDLCTISSSLLLFGIDDGMPRFVYGLVTLLIISVTLDQVINSNRQSVQFIIFSKCWEEIANKVNDEAHRGCTVLHGTGWYSKRDVNVLLVICRRQEAQTISRIIKSVDSDAFVTQANVKGVYGKGFDELKTRIKKPKQPTIANHNPNQYSGDQTSHSGHPQSMA